MKAIATRHVRKYTQGFCYEFAFGLWFEHDQKHRIALFRDGDSPWVHMTLEIGRGRFLDVNGLHVGHRDTARVFGLDPQYTAFFDAAEFWESVGRRRTEDRILFENEVEIARRLIRRHVDRYLLT